MPEFSTSPLRHALLFHIAFSSGTGTAILMLQIPVKMDIPFTVQHEGQLIHGYLSPPNGAGGGLYGYPTIFHVMVRQQNREYYWGQLMWNTHEQDWWLPDSKLASHTDYLGAVVQQWYE